jgi:hypothetical protein
VSYAEMQGWAEEDFDDEDFEFEDDEE